MAPSISAIPPTVVPEDLEASGTPTPSSRARTPPAHPVFGHALQVRADPLGTMARWSQEYGDVVRVKLRNWTYILNHPDDVRHVLVSHQARYQKGEAFHVARRVFGQGLLASEEPLHMAQRRFMQPALHRDAIQSYATTMVERSIATAGSWGPGSEIGLGAQMRQMTLLIAAKTMFGIDDVAETDALAHAIDIAQDFLYLKQTSPLIVPEWVPTPLNVRYWRAVDVMDRLVYRIIESRRKAPEGSQDLLTLLLEARDEQGRGMDDRQLRDEALTLLLAGHETTANALTWTFYLLAKYPAVEAQLLGELDMVLGGAIPTASDVARLRYTEMILAETMRMYPPAWLIPRVAIEDDVLATGVPVPSGQEVVVSPWGMQRNPRFYPEPERFDPERFSPDQHSARVPYAYFPFGGGNRRCIGESFAKMEMILALATIVPHVRMELVPGQNVRPEPRVTLRPRGEIRMRVAPRDPRTYSAA